MAQSRKNDYYHILHVSPDADSGEIVEAVRRMRERDKSGNYSAFINHIEETLTNPASRAQYDAEQGYTSSKGIFVDLNEDDLDKYSNKIEHHKYDYLKELEEYSVFAPHNQRRMGGYMINFQKLFMFLIFLLLALAAFIFSKPLLDRLDGKKQAEAALLTLLQSQKTVEAFIRKNGVFPENLNLTSNDNRFALRLDGGKNRIVLTFAGDVVDSLRNTEMTSTFMSQPNITYWQCDISSAFPIEFKPSTCY